MLLSTAGVQCGSQDALAATTHCIDSLSSCSSFLLLFRILWLFWWLEAPTAHPFAVVPKMFTIRMEVILSVMTATITVPPPVWTLRHACHAKFKARQFLSPDYRVISDGPFVSQSSPSRDLSTGD